MSGERLPVQNLFVVGASAGGFNALRELVAELPGDLQAALLVVLHISPNFPSLLHDFLASVGKLPTAQASQGEAIVAGRIYVAPPDCHLLVEDGRVALSHGPRENFSRPAIDPLFRSAAQAYGPRVTGVLLSGTLGDGTVGLMAIKAHGGTTVVQDPRQLQYSEMSELAIASAPIDHILSVKEIAKLLVKIASKPAAPAPAAMPSPLEDSSALVKDELAEQVNGDRSGKITVYACPECNGPLWQLDAQGGVQQFRCHVGHAYAPEALMGGMTNNLENALWTAVRSLVERATLRRQMAMRHRDGGRKQWAENLEAQAVDDEHHMKIIRENIIGLRNRQAPALTSKPEDG